MRRAVVGLWLASALTGCGGRSSSQRGDSSSSVRSGGSAQEPPCGPSQPLCDEDQCDGDGCAFVELAELPPPVGGLLASEEAVYVLADSNETIYRVPKCGGQPNVVARTTTRIGPFAVFGDSLFWIGNATGGGTSLYRTPVDGSAPSVEVTLTDAGGNAPSVANLVADASAVFVLAYSSPGIVRLDGAGATALFTPSAGDIVTQDDSALYFQAGNTGSVVAVDKLDGSSNTLVASNVGLLSGANSAGLYVAAYVNEPARVWRRLERVPAAGGDPVMVRDLASTAEGTVDERCGYFVDRSVASATAFRFPLAGGSAEVLHAAVATSLALASDTVYVLDATGAVFRRPK